MATKSELVFVALGGLGEIGMNCAMYGVGGTQKSWLMVDIGVSFGGPDTPGIDLIMPDISFAEENRKNLAGIIITHVHEDHYGALVDLWPRLGCPVYMTQFGADLLEARRLSEAGAPRIPVKIIKQGDRIKIGKFDVEFISVAHSIPEACALALRTEFGTVVHTGDWKIDATPMVGLPTDEKRLAEIGEEGVLALICDSTNVMREGESPSEVEVSSHLAKLIQDAPGRVAVTTFASNVARIRAVAEAAMECGREVILAGRAMDRVVGIARELGMMEGLPPFRGQDAYGYLPADKVVVILTGSQGEPRAALARVSADQHPDITLSAGDRVIFSSRTIPGNEREVGRIQNELVKQGVEIITDRNELVHVSGHPRRAELAKMYGWLKPQIAIPAHGEALHLTEHAKFARAQGVPNVVRPFNGDMVRLAPGTPEIIEDVKAGRVYKDGRILLAAKSNAISERKKLSFSGVVSIAIALDEKGEVVTDPEVMLLGLPAKNDQDELMLELIQDIVDDCLDNLAVKKRRDPDAVKNAVERAVKSAINQEWGKKPICLVMVMVV
jgi:ribonuclease J